MKSITIRSFSSPVYQTQRDCLLPRTSSQHEPWAGKFPPGFSQFQEKESKDVKKNHGKKSNFHLKKVSQLSCIQSMSNPYPILSKPPKNFTDLQLVLRAWTCRNLIRVLAVVRSPLTDGSDGIFPWVFLWKSMTSMAYGYIACEVCTDEGEHEAPCLPLAQVSQGSDRLMKDVAVHLGWFATHCLRTCGPADRWLATFLSGWSTTHWGCHTANWDSPDPSDSERIRWAAGALWITTAISLVGQLNFSQHFCHSAGVSDPFPGD